MNKDKLSGIIVFMIGAIWLLMSMQIKGNQYSTVIGPDIFPKLASGGMTLCGIGLFMRKPRGASKPFLSKEGWIRVTKLGGALIAYPFALEYLGFIIAAFCLMFITSTLFDLDKKTSIVKRVIFSAFSTGFIFIFFGSILKVLLPVGKIFLG